MPETIVKIDPITSPITVEKLENDFADHILLLEYCYGLTCSFCGTKVLDPDKSKNQINLKDRCPFCLKDPDEEKQRIAKERKQQNKKNNRQANRERNSRRKK